MNLETPRDVLEQSKVEGLLLYLPAQLSRKLYLDTNKILKAIGGRWVGRKIQAHKFDECPWDALQDYLLTGKVQNKKKDFQFFATPVALAEKIVAMAGLKKGMKALEPSAGEGVIADVIRGYGVEPDVCELWEKNRVILERKGYNVNCDDFLELESSGYDVIVMNPPFHKGLDIEHVLHAFGKLKEGGKLVSIMSPSWTYRTDSRFINFKNFVVERKGVWDEVPAGTFRDSGTETRTGILMLEK